MHPYGVQAVFRELRQIEYAVGLSRLSRQDNDLTAHVLSTARYGNSTALPVDVIPHNAVILARTERQRRAEEKAARKALLWRIFVIAVCVILILALSLPTMGLMFLGGN